MSQRSIREFSGAGNRQQRASPERRRAGPRRRDIARRSALVFTWVLGVTFGLATRDTVAAEEAWLTGDTFYRQLELERDMTWSPTPLRQMIDTLARAQRICIWLDRRIDPSRALEFSCQGVSLDFALKKLAAGVGAGVGYLDSVIYLGPKPVASKLATLAALRIEEAGQLPPAAQKLFLSRRSWQWPELATPRQLLAQLSQEGPFAIEGVEQVPHDLWPPGDLPSLSVAERLSFVLAGFDLTFQYLSEGKVVRLVPMPANATLERTYPAQSELVRIQRAFPDARTRRVGNLVVVSASYEDHVRIRRLLRGEKVPAATEVRYTLNVKNQPLRAVLQRIAQLGLAVHIDPRLDNQLQELVSFRLENGTLDELVQAAVRDRHIRYRLEGDLLQLEPSE